MKYIKKFDSVNTEYTPEYNIGDYVVLYSEDGVGKIKSFNFSHKDFDYWYLVEVIIQNQLIPMTLRNENIKRLATSEEIEEFELKIVTNKYNL